MRTTFITSTIIYLIALAIAGCDGQDVAEDPCIDLQPGPSLTSYFPLEVGKTWRYSYEEQHLGWPTPANKTTEGILEWTVTTIEDQCSRIDFTIQEQFEGNERSWFLSSYDTTVAKTWSRDLSAALVEDQLVIHGYTNGTFGLDSLQWLLATNAPQQVSADTSIAQGFGLFLIQASTMEKDTGITHFRYCACGRWTDSVELNLIR